MSSDIASARPQPLARYDGEGRCQAALDADRYFQLAVLTALLIAAVAGSGFGLLALRCGPIATASWAVMAAGLIARSIAPRGGVILRARDGKAVARAGEIAAVVAPLLALVAAMGGGDMLRTLACGAGGGAACWLVTRPLLPPAAGAMALRGLTAFAGLGWAALAWGMGLRDFDVSMFLAIAATVVALDVAAVRRNWFATLAAVALFLQLAAMPPSEELLRRFLWLQPLASLGAFMALLIAGLRYVEAARWRLPAATYRIYPLCVVPRLDRGLDHPVKINVA